MLVEVELGVEEGVRIAAFGGAEKEIVDEGLNVGAGDVGVLVEVV